MRSRLALVALAVFLAQMCLYVGYFTDDSYIYAHFATNLANYGELSFNLGEPVHAATSPLWAGLAALGAVAGFDAAAVLKFLGILCGALAVLVYARMVMRLFSTNTARWIVLLLLATEPWFVRWSASGMETSLGVLLLALLMDAGLRREDEVRWQQLAWSAGVLPLVRPEALLLVALIGVRLLVSPNARRRSGTWVALCMPMLAWSAIALPTFGSVLPATLQAKSTPLGLVPSRLFANLKTMLMLFGIAAALPAVGWLNGVLCEPRRLWSRSGLWFAPVLWVWTLALPLVYLIRDVQVVSRYLELVLPGMIVLAGLVTLGSTVARPLRLTAFAWVIVCLGLSSFWISPSSRAFGRSLDAGLGDIADWLKENSAPDAVVAIYDIGLVGYRSERRVLDLGGLTHHGINDLRNQVADDDILLDGRFLAFGDPEYLVDRDPVGNALAGQTVGGRVCEPILSRQVANLGLSRSAPVIYTLYRLIPVGP